MFFRLNVRLLLAAFFVTAAVPVFSQVVPSATQGRLPLVVGGGVSDYYTDWSGRLLGPSVWVDWNLYRGPSVLRGFGLEAEGRDLNYDRTGYTPNLRQDTALGGVRYTFHRFRDLHPYAKFLAGIGSIDFTLAGDPHYKHDTRTVIAPGGGLEYRVWRNAWVRADYEYQFWSELFNTGALNPQGLTLGVSYDLGNIHRR